jgi:hypothetical protein
MSIQFIRFFMLTVGLISCKLPKKRINIIAFSCMKCAGCVTNNLSYIKQKSLDKRYTIILDTTCYEEQMPIIRDINYLHMQNAEIENVHGRFGNFILVDSSGKKTEFMTDMHLRDIIK